MELDRSPWVTLSPDGHLTHPLGRQISYESGTTSFSHDCELGNSDIVHHMASMTRRCIVPNMREAKMEARRSSGAFYYRLDHWIKLNVALDIQLHSANKR